MSADDSHDWPACAIFRGGRCTCDRPASAVSEGTASAQRINAAPIPVRCDFGGICNRDHGAQCAAVCRRQRGEA
ncbi:hypothetical protein Q5W_09770 [Hydrogenophaga sp. PBC]|uniref:hypothetical protein n=1 Tax=Hydrogenophaga sp. PBC TaxID=795665 RepID=UPI0002607723|nr:hypothetical protein [Hydrogenophaga sp. PBC]AOS79231.1 hypothetical protein Q5W_09770 [Hydrogenophaga sp. PBC]